MALRVGNRSRRAREPASVLASKRAFVARAQSSSSSGRSNTRGSMTWNNDEFRVARTTVSLKGSVAIAVPLGLRGARGAVEIVRRNAGVVYRLPAAENKP